MAFYCYFEVEDDDDHYNRGDHIITLTKWHSEGDLGRYIYGWFYLSKHNFSFNVATLLHLNMHFLLNL